MSIKSAFFVITLLSLPTITHADYGGSLHLVSSCDSSELLLSGLITKKFDDHLYFFNIGRGENYLLKTKTFVFDRKGYLEICVNPDTVGIEMEMNGFPKMLAAYVEAGPDPYQPPRTKRKRRTK